MVDAEGHRRIMPTTTQQRKLISPFVISLILHVGTLKALEFLPKNFLNPSSLTPAKKNKPIKITSISRTELKKYRTVGVKNGKKNFSMPTKNTATTKRVAKKSQPKTIRVQTKTAPKKVTKTKRVVKKKKEISFNSLRVKNKIKTAPRLNQKMRTLEKKESTSKLEITTNKQVAYQRTREAQVDVLKQLANSPDNAKVLRKTGFNMQLEPPEGVSEDELNSMEKIYYSFQKRTFKSYVGSFLKTYRSYLTNRPSMKQTLRDDPHRLAARVIFDMDGNIVSIKIMRSSTNDDIHDMFEETLKEIRKLPNPPKDLVTKKGDLTIYYQLNIN